MKHFLNKNKWLTSVTIGLSAYAGFACADYGYDYFTSNFTPELFVSKNLEPLNFDSYSKFYLGNSYYGTGLNSGGNMESDINDWLVYTKKVIPAATIQTVMYSKAEDREMQLKKLTQSSNKQVRNLADFASLANQIDVFSAVEVDPWDYKPGPLRSGSLAKKAEDKYKETTDVFLKSRYWFLTLKAYFYSKDKKQVIRFFNETQAQNQQHKYFANAVDYVAGAYYANHDFVNANLHFAEVVVLDETKIMPATRDFKVLSNSDFDKMLAQAKSTEVKAAIWTIMGYKKDELKALQEVYKLDSNSKFIPVLLARAININEAAFSSFYEKEIETADNAAYLTRASKAVNAQLFDLVKQGATKMGNQNTQMWQLAYGYLSMYKADYKTAEKCFNLVSNSTDNQLLKDEARLFKFLNKILQTTKLNNNLENDFVAEYNWLMFSKLDPETYYNDYEQQKIRVDAAQNFVNQFLANIYQKEKNIVLAQMLKPKANFYLNDKNLAATDVFFSKKKFSNWERAVMNLYNVKADDVYQQIAFKALQKDDLTTALSYLEKTDSKVNSFYNPFNGLIKDRNVNESKRELSYKKVLEMMQEMKQNIEAKTDIYNNALLLGNAYYNLSFFGNNREIYWNSVFFDLDNSYPSNATYKYDNSAAKKYYTIALQHAADDEQKAKITYLLTKVERNEFYTKNYFLNADYYNYDKVMFKKFDGYKVLKDKYKHTKYYKEVINECGYFKKYANLH